MLVLAYVVGIIWIIAGFIVYRFSYLKMLSEESTIAKPTYARIETARMNELAFGFVFVEGKIRVTKPFKFLLVSSFMIIVLPPLWIFVLVSGMSWD